MKKFIIIVQVMMCTMLPTAFAAWQQKTSLPSAGRVIPNIFVFGNEAYVAGGFKAGNIYLNENWKYDITTDVWTQMANMPANVAGGVGFRIGNKGYVALGWLNGANHNGVYQYDPTLNSWVVKNNFPGSPRYSSCIFTIAGKAYIGLGYSPLHNDFWEYNPVSDTWSQKANFPGGPRQATIHFALNGLGYVGLGLNNVTTYAGLNDFYSYNATNNTWTQLANFRGPGRHSAVTFLINNKAYMTCGNTGNAAGTTFNDLWEYDPQNGLWSQYPDLPSTPRQSGGAFSSENCGFVFGGMYQPTTTYFDQLWQFCLEIETGVSESPFQADIVSAPGSSEYIFKHSSITAHSNLEIFNLEGKIVFNQKVVAEETKINLSQLSKGIYLWRFFLDNGTGKAGKIVL